MSDNGFQIQIQIMMADEVVREFLDDPGLESSGVVIQGTKRAEKGATIGFDLPDSVTIINAVATALNNVTKLAGPLARLLKKSPRPLVVVTAFGTVKLDPSQALTENEIRKLLATPATL